MDSDALTFTSIQTIHLDCEEGDRLYFESKYLQSHQSYQALLQQITVSSQIESSELSSLYYKLGLSSFKLGKFADAHNFFDRALDIAKTLRNNVPERARILNADGEAYTREGKFSEAEERLNAALGLIKDNYGEENIEIIACYNKLADLLDQKEQYENMLEYLDKAIQISLNLKVELSEELATSYFRSATAHYFLYDNPKAVDSIQKALSIRKQIYGENHVDIALCYRILGDINCDEGKSSESFEHYEKGLKMLIQLVGENNLDVGDFYSNMGRAYRELGDYDKSLKCHQKAWEINQRFLPEDHQYRAFTYANIGDIFKEQGRYQEALDAYDKALQQFTRKFGEDHWRIGTFLRAKAVVYEFQGRYSEAIKLVKKQLAIQLNCFGPKDVGLGDTYDYLAFLSYKCKKFREEMAYYLKSLEINSFSLKERLQDAGFNFYNMSSIFGYLRNLNSRISLDKKALVCYEKALGKNYDKTLQCCRNLEEAQKRKCLYDLNHEFPI